MRILMHDESDLTLSRFEEPGFEVETEGEVHAHYSALQMFATSLGLCTASVLLTYGERVDAEPDDLTVRVAWTYTEDPYRVDEIEMDIDWPSLPESRLEAARRAAETCTIHNTLHHPPDVETRVNRPGES
mgnify:CR=1 FL=1